MWGIKQIIVTNDQFLTSSQSASILLVDSRDSSTTLLAFMLMASSSDWRSASIIVTDIWNKCLQSPEILQDSV